MNINTNTNNLGTFRKNIRDQDEPKTGANDIDIFNSNEGILVVSNCCIYRLTVF